MDEDLKNKILSNDRTMLRQIDKFGAEAPSTRLRQSVVNRAPSQLIANGRKRAVWEKFA